MSRRRLLRYGALVLLGMGILLAAQGAWIQAKAHLARYLVAAAWERTLDDGRARPGAHLGAHLGARSGTDGGTDGGLGRPPDPATHRRVHKPWPWADHWPVARLIFPARQKDLVVLEGDTGNVLAFAPGHAVGSGLGGDDRAVVISGHRDTHFRFLADLVPGETVELETLAGRRAYRVDSAAVIDSRTGRIPLDGQSGRLLLVTCYPFDALRPGGPLRYVVTAAAVAGARVAVGGE